VVAHHLGVPPETVVAHVGRSSYPPGPASGGSVTSRFTAPRMFSAANKARDRLLDLVAAEWSADRAALVIQDGYVSSGNRKMSWQDSCRLIPEGRITVSESDEGEFWKEPTGSEAVQFAEVEVDTETGIIRVIKIVALQEMGLPVNRLMAENQIVGAVIQGMSFALFEDRILDRQTGSMVNPNFDMYKIAGPVDVPEIVPIIWKERDDAGVNSLGEPPVIPTAGAIGCAVANALGAPVRTLPLTPARVLDAVP
jgi:xanthine dehydrogenase YagR molybdenum-binding subunit